VIKTSIFRIQKLINISRLESLHTRYLFFTLIRYKDRLELDLKTK
jgi:hypothetical protein